MSQPNDANRPLRIGRRRYLALAGTGLVGVSTGVAGCTGSPGGDEASPEPTEAEEAPEEDEGGDSTAWQEDLGTDQEFWMVMGDVVHRDSFFPSTLFVNQGESVGMHVKNTGDEPHDFEIPAFDIEVEEAATGAVVTRTFTADTPGVHPIECELHPEWMYGQLVVLPESGDIPTVDGRTLRIAMGDVAHRDSFMPSTNVVVEGEEVTIQSVNNGDEPHDFEIPAFDIEKEEVATETEFESTFTADTPGIHEMECELHPEWMWGQLIVLPADGDYSRIGRSDDRTLRIVMGDIAERESFFPSTNVVKQGEEVTLELKNTGDEVHDLDIEAFGVEVDVEAGKEKTLSFTADAAGIEPMVCELHPPEMNGQLWVVP